uniref:Vacuolar ATPase assembly protein VMA22 n=1 Tax=Podarcis muralis TaxID=64176 RepID=A0A670KHU4_PODMU
MMAPAQNAGPAEVCEELDQVILHLFDTLEMLQTKRKAFNNLIEQGWFSLSKSRYAMGNKSVSPLQYGHQMTPMVQVKTRKKDNGQMGFHVVSEDVKAAKPTATDAVEEIGPSEQVLRWRKGPGKAQAPAQPPKAFRKAAEGSGHQNPLTWFGILVPQSLRQAQRTFQEGIQLAAEIASLQSDIETTQRHYHALLGEKHKLVAREKQRCP